MSASTVVEFGQQANESDEVWIAFPTVAVCPALTVHNTPTNTLVKGLSTSTLVVPVLYI